MDNLERLKSPETVAYLSPEHCKWAALEIERLRGLLNRVRDLVDMVARTDDDPEITELRDDIDSALTPNGEAQARAEAGEARCSESPGA